METAIDSRRRVYGCLLAAETPERGICGVSYLQRATSRFQGWHYLRSEEQRIKESKCKLCYWIKPISQISGQVWISVASRHRDSVV
eukprot:1097482-Rhodomonas_salina.3